MVRREAEGVCNHATLSAPVFVVRLFHRRADAIQPGKRGERL